MTLTFSNTSLYSTMEWQDQISSLLIYDLTTLLASSLRHCWSRSYHMYLCVSSVTFCHTINNCKKQLIIVAIINQIVRFLFFLGGRTEGGHILVL